MISIAVSQVKHIISQYVSDIDKFIVKGQDGLWEIMDNTALNKTQKDYIALLFFELENIVLANPVKLREYMQEFEDIIPHKQMEAAINIDFRDAIQEALGYKTLRTNFYPTYFLALNIKACVYCNSQLAVSIKRNNNQIMGKYQVDHFYPKSEYPCFSISLFNLYPVCGCCNNVKLNRIVNFNLYTNDAGQLKSPYKFVLDPTSKLSFINTGNVEDIEFQFNEPKPNHGEKSLNELFDIEGIYNTQKDIAQELILKSRSCPKAYKEGLMRSFPKIFHSPEILNRLLVGNYTEAIDIHKRPLAKFMMDIAGQLGMLK